MDEEKRTLGLHLGKIEQSDTGDSFSFSANVVEITGDEKVRNGNGKPHENLCIQCYISKSSQYHSIVPEFRDLYSVGLTRVEEMVKLLRQIHGRTRSHYRKYGASADPADAFMRLAHAIGVKVYVIAEGPSRGWSYDDQDHRLVWEHDMAASIIRRLFTEAGQPAEKREVA